MGIFSVTHGLPALQGDVDSLRQFLQLADGDGAVGDGEAFQLGGNFSVVTRGARVGLARQPQPG